MIFSMLYALGVLRALCGSFNPNIACLCREKTWQLK